MTIQKFIEQISSVLKRQKIDYVIAGGIAVSVWGKPRHTADVDIVVKINNIDTIKNLVEELKKELKDIYLEKARAIDAFKQKSEFNLIESAYGLKADFFIAKDSEYGQLEIERGIEKNIDGINIKFISPEDLIINKLLWYKETQSTRQLEDILSVLDIQLKIDKAYLKKWVEKLKLKNEWQELLEISKKDRG